ncbi:MAG: NUDIX domain-containing protein [Candidatus Delongbacteria bacterium]|nr:NUDIX domain-containing protein [Candidatus Delongbacteria bacterium]
MSQKAVAGLELLDDVTDQYRSDQGFMRIKRYRIANRYQDGSCSDGYRCDVVYRESVDAVGIVLYWTDDSGRRIVILRRCLRPALYFRPRLISFSEAGPPPISIYEIPAGVIEPGEITPEQIRYRAVQEVWEETGIRIQTRQLLDLGAPIYTSPGFCIEKVRIMAARIEIQDWDNRCLTHSGDGSLMEEGAELVPLLLDEAIRRCREENYSDGKTELALCRLYDKEDG